MTWRHFLGATALASALFGCVDAPSSRQLAVTLTDATEMECIGVSASDALEQKTMDSIARDVENNWEDAQEAQPPTPEGRVLRVNETERGIRAWFDPHPGSDFVGDVDGFDGPRAVYVGDFHDDYIEAVYQDVFNTDEDDEDAGREPCGNRVRTSGILSVTDVKGILGRIRWQHNIYVDSVTSACSGRIECVRDIAVDGLELE